MAVLGVGGVLVGLTELGLGCMRRRTWPISLAIAAVLALAGGTAFALGEGRNFGQPALALAGALVLMLLVRSKHSLAGRPLVQGALLVVVGGALMTWAVYRLEQGLESELLDSDVALAQMADPIDPNSPPALMAQTDAGTPIPLFEPSSSALAAPLDVEARFLHDQRLNGKAIQTAPSDVHYNCHGWVFTGGRFWLRGGQVEAVLKDNAYQPVEKPHKGDLAVFRNPLGEVTHTGLVRTGTGGTVLIESKWGRFGRFVHGPDEHAYRGHQVTYYRSPPGTHLLKGLGDDDRAVPASAE